MAWNKISKHRQLLENYAVKKLQDSSGNEYTVGSVASGKGLRITGTGIVGYDYTASYGALTITGANAVQTTLTTNIWTKLAGTSVLQQYLETTQHANNRLRYVGTPTSKFLADFSATIKATLNKGDTRIVDLAFAVSAAVGGPVINSGSMITLELTNPSSSAATSARYCNGSSHCILSLPTNSSVEVWAKVDSTTTVTASALQSRLYRIL